MSTMIRKYKQSLLVIGVLSMLFTPRLVAAQCVGDCTTKGSTTASDVGKITQLILVCPGGEACGQFTGGDPNGCAAFSNPCVAADFMSPFGCLTAGELGKIKDYVLRLVTCPPFPTSTPGGASPTPTNTPTPVPSATFTSTPTQLPTPTNTPTPLPTNTPTSLPTNTPTTTPSPTATITPVTPSPAPTGARCGNGVVEPPDEDCDPGGVCTGGYNAGTPCTSDSQCVGQGVCLAGANGFQACDTDEDCPWSQCVRCKVFGGAEVPGSGGKTCAANCTFESTYDAKLVTGIVYGSGGGYSIEPGTSTSTVHASGITARGLSPLALGGDQVYAYGKLRNGLIPLRQPMGGGQLGGPTPGVAAIDVGGLACACVRAVEGMTCGGVLTEKDGSAVADCTTGWVEGTCSDTSQGVINCYENDPGGWAVNGNDCYQPIPPTPSVGRNTRTPTLGPTWTPEPAGTCVVPNVCATYAAGRPTPATPRPCSYVHGAGNSATGLIGCNELDAANLYYSQDSGFSPYPQVPTPPEGSGPAVVKLRNACECSNDSDCGPGESCDAAGRCTCTTLGNPLTITFNPGYLTFVSCTKAAGVGAGKSLDVVLSPLYLLNKLTMTLGGDSAPIPDGEIANCTFTISGVASPGSFTTLNYVVADLVDDQSIDYFASGKDSRISIVGVGVTPTSTPTPTSGGPTATPTPGGPRFEISDALGHPGGDVTVSISFTKNGPNIVAIVDESDCKDGETCVCPAGNTYDLVYPYQGSPMACPTPHTGECIYYQGCVQSSDCPAPEVCRSGPPGSIVVVNSTAIGLTQNNLSGCSFKTPTPATGIRAQYGPDHQWCTDDDPQSSRGPVQTLPILSGFSAGFIYNMYNKGTPTPLILGPYTQIGNPLDCGALLAPTPSASGLALGGAFTALNQPNLENDVTTNIQWVQ